MKINPDNDGLDHINLYSKGKTPLGRSLSNFALTPFAHPSFGGFYSVEGFWYWLKTGLQHDQLRTLYGYRAKKQGTLYESVSCEHFESIICEAIECKVRTYPSISYQLATTDLPLVHYYRYGDQLITPSSGLWQCAFLEQLRYQLRCEPSTLAPHLL